MSADVTCPDCGATGTKIVDVEIRGVYDGALFHGCLDCDRTFHRRWATEGVRVMMEAKAAEYMPHGLRALLGTRREAQPPDAPDR